MSTRLVNTLFVITGTALIAFVLSASHLIDDHSTEQAQADSLQDAIKEAQARDRFTKAAAKMCGSQAGWIEQADGRIRCTLHTGRRTSKTAMVVTP